LLGLGGEGRSEEAGSEGDCKCDARLQAESGSSWSTVGGIKIQGEIDAKCGDSGEERSRQCETSLPISRAEAEQELGHDSWPGRKGANRRRPALKTRDEFFQLIAESDSIVLRVAVNPNVRFVLRISGISSDVFAHSTRDVGLQPECSGRRTEVQLLTRESKTDLVPLFVVCKHRP